MKTIQWPIMVALCCACAWAPSAAAQLQPTHPNLTFAPLTGRALELDLYLPTSGTGPFPVVVWIHGGGWQSGARFPIPTFIIPLLGRGVAIASVSYRLTSQANLYDPLPVIFSAQIHDVKGAVRWLRANAETYNLDPARFGVWGPSAGGHLSALLATSAGVAGAEGDIGGNLAHSSAVQACVDYFGPTDLLNMTPDITTPPGGASHDGPTSPESRLLGWDDPGQGIGDIRANSSNPNAPYPALVALATLANPVAYVDAEDPPTFIAHGTVDITVPIRQSERLRDALALAGVDHHYTPVVGAGHGGFPSAVHLAAIDFLVGELTGCLSDLDGDGIVAASDLGVLLGAWGGASVPADLSGDGVVSSPDLAIMLAAWGACGG